VAAKPRWYPTIEIILVEKKSCLDGYPLTVRSTKGQINLFTYSLSKNCVMKNLILTIAMFCGLAANATNPSPCDYMWVTLPAGSLVILETAEKIQSDQVTVGKIVTFRVRTAVFVDGHVLIASGALAIGRVKSIRETTYNSPEEITLAVISAQAVDGQQVALNDIEQTYKGRFPNEAATVETGQTITAAVMNNSTVKVP
jgi:hypothetical protein